MQIPVFEPDPEVMESMLHGSIVMSIAAWFGFTILCSMMMFVFFFTGQVVFGLVCIPLVIADVAFINVLVTNGMKDWKSQE